MSILAFSLFCPVPKAYANDSGSEIQVMPPTPRSQLTSQINFCNKTSNKTIFTAFVSLQDSNGWQSSGWYAVKPGLCRTKNIGRGYSDDIYVYAKSGTSSWGDGDAKASFCVNKTQAFTIPNSDKSCNGSNYQFVSMKKIMFRNKSQQTWNISD